MRPDPKVQPKGTTTAEPDHTIVCNHWGGDPFWLDGTETDVNGTWDCTDYVEVRACCIQTQMWDPVDKSWFYNSAGSQRTNSTALNGVITARGVCGGGPGRWTQKYRMHAEFQEFHGNWLLGSYDSTPGTLNC